MSTATEFLLGLGGAALAVFAIMMGIGWFLMRLNARRLSKIT